MLSLHTHTNQDLKKKKKGKCCWVTLTLQSQTLTNKRLQTIKHTKRLHTASPAAISTNYLNILLFLLAISKVNSQDRTKQAN